jgi:DNA-binding transcriptional MerR regulator
MVRKHYPWTRARMTRSRPKTPAPKTGWVIAELSRISGVPVRRLRDYVFRDLIQPLERRGTATRYQRGQLVRLMAIKRLRKETELKLADIKRHLDAKGERELEAWILTGPLPDAVLEALGHPSAKVTTEAQPLPSNTSPSGATFTSSDVASRVGAANSNDSGVVAEQSPALATWYHVQLLPGLTLQLSANASPAVRKAAKRICEEYVGS